MTNWQIWRAGMVRTLLILVGPFAFATVALLWPVVAIAVLGAFIVIAIFVILPFHLGDQIARKREDR